MIRVTMPQASQTMETGTILSWRKTEGEAVRKGEVLLEIETDKATFEVEVPESGFLRKILCHSGATVPVLAPIAIVAGQSEDIGAAIEQALSELGGVAAESYPAGALPAERPVSAGRSAPAPGSLRDRAEVPAVSQLPPDGRIKASPLAQRIARDRNLNLRALWPGSGPGGRIIAVDLDRTVAPAAASPVPVRRKMSAMRGAIARNLLASKQSIPHFYVRLTIDAGPLQAFHREQKARYACTVTDIITLACAKVIVDFPAFRSRIEGEDLIEYTEANIGLAVAVDDGLRVPVLVAAERRSLRGLAGQARKIIEGAQKGRVEAMGHGVFTISNLGMYGIEEFAAIINPPESAILAVGAIRESVIARDGALRAGRVMTMTLSADHRIIDGLMAARFLGRLKEILEAPEVLAEEGQGRGAWEES